MEQTVKTEKEKALQQREKVHQTSGECYGRIKVTKALKKRGSTLHRSLLATAPMKKGEYEK